MPVGFSTIPQDLRVPLFYAEMDPSAANTAAATLRRLIVGQVNDDATAPEIGKLCLVSSEAQAKAIAGNGSMLAAMYAAHRKNDPTGEVWCLPLKLTGGAKAAGTVTITGAATESGELFLYVAGVLVRATVIKGDAAAAVATALVSAINAAVDLPVTAAAVAGVVTLTCKWSGVTGHDVLLEMNRLGRAQGQVTPAGLTVAVGAMAAGAGEPDQVQAVAALGDEPFEFIAMPWATTPALDAWAVVMNDAAGRWSYAKQLYGHVYSALRGTLGTLVAFGQARNDQHATIQAMEASTPSPVWCHAAALAARTAAFISADASRPTQTGELVGLVPPAASARFTLVERQSLLGYGLATSYFEGGAVRIQRSVTTYQRNAYGQADNSYMDSESMHQLAFIVRRLRTLITSKYGRHKLASDGTRFGAGQPIVTPSVIRGELVAEYARLESEGHVENADAFARHLVVERNASNPSRLDVLLPPDLVNGLRVFAALVQFRQQFPAGA